MAAPTTAQQPDSAMVMQLPPELHVRIGDYIGYHEAIRLSQVNRHFHTVISPATWPAESRAAFVQQAQRWLKHNELVHIIGTGGATIMKWMTHRFACYSCYRVLALSEFSVMQIVRGKAKNSPHDDVSSGCGRFGIECGIRSGTYRKGTRIKTIRCGSLDAQRRYTTDKEDHFLCPTCACFRLAKRPGEPCRCRTCRTTTAFKRHRNIVFPDRGANIDRLRFSTCEQCGGHTLQTTRSSTLCVFCGKDVCRECGGVVDTRGGWWRGRACGREAVEFVWDREDRWPVKFRLPDLMREKNRRRLDVAWKGTDLLEREDVEDALRLLAL